MLRVTVIDKEKKTVLKVEGRLVGAWVDELKRCWMLTVNGKDSKPTVIDLTSVTFADSVGKELIREMCFKGAELHVSGPLMNAIVDEMRAELRSAQGNRVQEAS